MKKSIFFILPIFLVLSSCQLVEKRSLDFENKLLVSKEVVKKMEEEIIKIGSITPLGDNSSNIGESAVNGIELAVSEINEKIQPERKIIIVHEDGNCNQNDAQNATNQLISKYNVKAIIGGVCSDETIGIVKATKKNPLPVITLFSTDKKARTNKEWLHHLNNSDENQAQKSAEIIYSIQNITSLFAVSDNQENSIEMMKAFEEKYKYLGGEIVNSFEMNDDKKSVEEAITEYITTDIQYVYISANEENTFQFLDKLKSFDQVTTIFGTDVLANEHFKSVVSKSNIELYYLSATENNNNAWLDFASKYNLKYGKLPTFGAAEGYDAINLLGIAISSIEENTNQSIKKNLRSIKNYNGASGDIEFDQNGNNILKKWNLWNINKAEIKLVTSL